MKEMCIHLNKKFKELTDETTPYVRSGTLPLMELPSMSFYNTSNRLEQYLLSCTEEINTSSPYYGLDTEFEYAGGELTILSLSFSTFPTMVISSYELKSKVPIILKKILSSKERFACGRNVGGDCNKLESQCGVYIPRRYELSTLCLMDKPELRTTKGGTGVAHLTETYLHVRLPIEKLVGQSSSFATKNLSQGLILYAAADTYCHRLITEKIMNSLQQKQQHNSNENISVLCNDKKVLVNYRSRPIAEGIMALHGTTGKQIKLGGTRTLGKNHVKVKVKKVLQKSHIPKIRNNMLWPTNKHTLIELWDTVDDLEIVTSPDNLSLVLERDGNENIHSEQDEENKVRNAFNTVVTNDKKSEITELKTDLNTMEYITSKKNHKDGNSEEECTRNKNSPTTNIKILLSGGKKTISATNDNPIGPVSKNNIKIPKPNMKDDEIYGNYNLCTSDIANEEEKSY